MGKDTCGADVTVGVDVLSVDVVAFFGMEKSMWVAGTSGVVTVDVALFEASISLDPALRSCDEAEALDGDETFCNP